MDGYGQFNPFPPVLLNAGLPPLYNQPQDNGNNMDFEFRFDMLPFLVNQHEQNPMNVRIINRLHDRTLDALYEIQDKNQQALEIAQATFDAMMLLQKEDEEIQRLYDREIQSNIFGGGRCSGEDFFRKIKEFPATWTVFDACYPRDDNITGRVSCNASDQMIKFSMNWQVEKRHFAITALDLLVDDSEFPAPVYGQQQMHHVHRPPQL